MRTPTHRVLSFKYAFEGLILALKEEPNIKIHLSIAIIAVGLGVFFQIRFYEWLMMVVVIGLVIGLELTNTAIEAMLDHLIPERSPAAKKAKDIAAGAVLVASITALIIGIMIFFPYLQEYLQNTQG